MATQPFYDVFITRAYEDEHEFTGRLALAFKRRGLKVWYSGFELKRGTSIASCINKTLAQSTFGVVVLGPVYFSRLWAIHELKWLLTVESEKKRVLVVLHGISMSAGRTRLPLLPHHLVVSHKLGLESIVNMVLKAVRANQPAPGKTKKRTGRNRGGQPAENAPGMLTESEGVIVLGGKSAPRIPGERMPGKRPKRK